MTYRSRMAAQEQLSRLLAKLKKSSNNFNNSNIRPSETDISLSGRSDRNRRSVSDLRSSESSSNFEKSHLGLGSRFRNESSTDTGEVHSPTSINENVVKNTKIISSRRNPNDVDKTIGLQAPSRSYENSVNEKSKKSSASVIIESHFLDELPRPMNIPASVWKTLSACQKSKIMDYQSEKTLQQPQPYNIQRTRPFHAQVVNKSEPAARLTANTEALSSLAKIKRDVSSPRKCDAIDAWQETTRLSSPNSTFQHTIASPNNAIKDDIKERVRGLGVVCASLKDVRSIKEQLSDIMSSKNLKGTERIKAIQALKKQFASIANTFSATASNLGYDVPSDVSHISASCSDPSCVTKNPHEPSVLPLSILDKTTSIRPPSCSSSSECDVSDDDISQLPPRFKNEDPKIIKKRLRAKHDYMPEKEGYLALVEGQILETKSPSINGCWIVENNGGDIGKIPVICAEPVFLASELPNGSATLGAVRVMTKRALYDYRPDDPLQLHFKKGDIITVYGELDCDGFWTTSRNGKNWLVPSNFVDNANPGKGTT
eukprot:UC4_evm2s502